MEAVNCWKLLVRVLSASRITFLTSSSFVILLSSNVSSIVKANVAPIMDALKYSMKEYTVESERGVGNPSIQIPSKSTTYDPDNHIMKTTIKETTIHDNETINPLAHTCTQVHRLS